MNKEQKKPQDMCLTHPHSFHKNIPKDVYCNHCEQPQSDSESDFGIKQEEEDLNKGIRLLARNSFTSWGSGSGAWNLTPLLDYIHANFISRKALRKLLEEIEIKGKLKIEGNKSQQDQIWGINYGLKKTIADILAEIEKL